MRSNAQVRAFSLVELLVVMSVIAVLSALTIPAVTSTLRATSLSTAGRVLTDQFNFARQTAQARNLPVEVRLYKLPDYDKPVTDPPAAYRAVAIFLIDEQGEYVALSKPEYFRSPVIISPGVEESALLADAATSGSPHVEHPPDPANAKAGVYGSNYAYIAFQFTPSGSTDLSVGKNFLTVVLQNEKPLDQGANFYTVQIDRINGSVRSFRP